MKPTRPRRHKQKTDMKSEIVVQVHKTTKSSDTSSKEMSDNGRKIEDKNDNYSATSREVSVDEESQINSKILSLIATEMKRDLNKHTHFTDSRPQSLSFYEDEKMPEELSGNLELLSPEERKHYRRKKEYSQDTDERNAYNVIQDLYNSRDEEIIGSTKKSKSRKKRYGDPEAGIGDSREMMIPKEKKKSKKKKRDASPMQTGKRKHKKRDEEYEPRTDITIALEELQDDVFENNNEEYAVGRDKIRRSPKRPDRVYTQKKNRFEPATRPIGHLNRQSAYDFEDDHPGKSTSRKHPLEIAIIYEKYWIRIANICHGLLAGLAFGHWLYLMSYKLQDNEFVSRYSHYSDVYECIFYLLSVLCVVSVLDKVDLAGLKREDIWNSRKNFIILSIYFLCLFIHLLAARIDYRFNFLNEQNSTNISTINYTIPLMSNSELIEWNHLSLWRSILAFIGWIILGFTPEDNRFYTNLQEIGKFLPDK